MELVPGDIIEIAGALRSLTLFTLSSTTPLVFFFYMLLSYVQWGIRFLPTCAFWKSFLPTSALINPS